VTLAWDPNPEPDVQGYYLYWGTESGIYPNSQSTSNTVSTVQDLTPGETYFFVVTAYNPFGESGPSNEVGYTIPGSDFFSRTLFPTNLTPTNVTLIGHIDQLPGEFGAFFEWSGGTNLNTIQTVFPSQVVYTNASNLVVQASFPIVPTNYTYRLVVTNAANVFESAPVTFATRAPIPVRIRFQVHIIQTTALGGPPWEEYLVTKTTLPFPAPGDDNRFYTSRLSFGIEYDQDIPQPPPLR